MTQPQPQSLGNKAKVILETTFVSQYGLPFLGGDTEPIALEETHMEDHN